MKKWLLYVFSLMLNSSVFAVHINDTLQISEVEVKTQKIYFVNTTDDFDSARLAFANTQTLARFLQENSSIQFKSYGSSGSSVMSIRGANSSQSKVIWNGLSIGSPMLNMNDVSILSVNNTDEITLSKGGSTATFGNSALAGVIGLENKALYNANLLNVGLNFNSLNNADYAIRFYAGNRSISSQTSININQYKNNYSYHNRSELGNPLQKQLNSESNLVAILQSFFYQSKRQQFDLHQWYQESDRNLSPAIYNRSRTNYQLDKSYRGVLNYKYDLNKNHNIKSLVGFTREQLRYVSRIFTNNQNYVLFNTRSFFDQAQFNLAWNYNSKDSLFWGNQVYNELKFQYVFDGAYVEDYNQYRKRDRVALTNKLQYIHYSLFSLKFDTRLEHFKNNLYFASSIQLNIIKSGVSGLVPYVRLSKNYNLPGLNDLYWVPGGNPNLNAEKSFEQELGFNYCKETTKLKWKSSFSAYHSLVSDWILWQPSAIENGIWTPQNLVEVKLQGIEIDQNINYTFSGLQSVNATVFYAFIQAINNKAVNANDQSVGKQLIYVPMEKMGVNITYQYSKNKLNFNFHRVSHRYTTSDHTEFLPSYQLIDLKYQREFELASSLINAGVYIDNIFNTTYESIPFQAMPARVFGINFNYKLTIKKH